MHDQTGSNFELSDVITENTFLTMTRKSYDLTKIKTCINLLTHQQKTQKINSL